MFKKKDEQTKEETAGLGLAEEAPNGENEEKEMMAAGLHFGHRTSRLHPRMENFVVGIRNTTHIIDLKKTQEYLVKALQYIEDLLKKGGILMFVSTKPPLKKVVQEAAESCSMPYVVERWLGGTFTNFPVISKRLKFYKELLKQKEEGGFDKYTKKEKIKLERTLQEMKKKFEGMKTLDNVPDAVFVCDIIKDKLCVKEAKMKGIKTIALVDSNADPLAVDYFIPANDDAILAVKYILDKVAGAINNIKTQNSKLKTAGV